MKLIGILAFLLPVYIYAETTANNAPVENTEAQALPPEPTPPQPDRPDTTLVGTKKQHKEGKKKADQKMKEAGKKSPEPPSNVSP
ncbi:hypothetical protein [Bdellovibrio svalbardensis]|uniref:Uncharacterized protein n=1 Tax=Bdellovibrio svalbardensis TaxID=2972972 RepID=A0ABT6DIY7_9BACT|nr:hypothetical protein [Bdellovibrio svalbardensis]MDG0816821.1 hypothetical protein [Bdellovibrio svalbardensis]